MNGCGILESACICVEKKGYRIKTMAPHKGFFYISGLPFVGVSATVCRQASRKGIQT